MSKKKAPCSLNEFRFSQLCSLKTRHKLYEAMQNIVYIQVQPATNFLKLLKALKPPIWGIDGLSLTEVLSNNSSHITNYMWIFLHIVLCLGVFFPNNTFYLTMFDVHLVPNTVYMSLPVSWSPWKQHNGFVFLFQFK